MKAGEWRLLDEKEVKDLLKKAPPKGNRARPELAGQSRNRAVVEVQFKREQVRVSGFELFSFPRLEPVLGNKGRSRYRTASVATGSNIQLSYRVSFTSLELDPVATAPGSVP